MHESELIRREFAKKNVCFKQLKIYIERRIEVKNVRKKSPWLIFVLKKMARKKKEICVMEKGRVLKGVFLNWSSDFAKFSSLKDPFRN